MVANFIVEIFFWMITKNSNPDHVSKRKCFKKKKVSKFRVSNMKANCQSKLGLWKRKNPWSADDGGVSLTLKIQSTRTIHLVARCSYDGDRRYEWPWTPGRRSNISLPPLRWTERRAGHAATATARLGMRPRLDPCAPRPLHRQSHLASRHRSFEEKRLRRSPKAQLTRVPSLCHRGEEDH